MSMSALHLTVFILNKSCVSFAVNSLIYDTNISARPPVLSNYLIYILIINKSGYVDEEERSKSKHF